MSKVCKYCGGQINEGDKFCQACGASTEDAVETTTTVNRVETAQEQVNNNVVNNGTQTPSKTNGTAIASFVCSLVGILIAALIMGILGISLSVTAKKHIKVFPNEKGKGLATAGMVIGIIDLVFWFIGVIAKLIIEL